MLLLSDKLLQLNRGFVQNRVLLVLCDASNPIVICTVSLEVPDELFDLGEVLLHARRQGARRWRHAAVLGAGCLARFVHLHLG